MAISLTPQAAEHVRGQIERRGSGAGIRLGIKTTGCSGLAYVLEFVDQPNNEDKVFHQHGIDVYVDPKSLTYIDGTKLDFVQEGVNEGLKFSNPNSSGECGCGESFHI
jgi:iron-sulfur cluster assembly protein